MTCIGIIGGSGLENFPELENVQIETVDTKWGSPSAPLIKGQLGEVDVVFLSRHGETHAIAPHLINYRANIAALKSAGVNAIVSVNAVGGIDPEICPGDLVIPTQIVDYTHGRANSFFDGQEQPLQHADFSYPYCDTLRQLLVQQVIEAGLNLHARGVYGVTQGPRLETAAEVIKLERDGCNIVGMTGMPETILARELDIPYACLALVVNPAAGISEGVITMDDIQAMMEQGMAGVRGLLVDMVRSYRTS